jgi:prolyl 4-hydroxylase
MHSPFGSLSFVSLIQYLFLGAVAYILAGAPLSSLLTSSPSGTASPTLNLDTLVIPDPALSCPPAAFKNIHILHRDPLVIYIEGFVSDAEARHVLNIRFASP